MKKKVYVFDRAEKLEKLLNEGWVINGGFNHGGKAVLILQKVV